MQPLAKKGIPVFVALSARNDLLLRNMGCRDLTCPPFSIILTD